MRGAGKQAFSACLIGYIHGLICDSITLFHSDACNTKALRNESMLLEVLEAEEPAVFRQELFDTLVHFYEEILGLPGAGGRPKPQSFKRKMSRVLLLLRSLVASPLKTPLMSRLLHRRRWRGVVEPNRHLREQQPPPPGRQQESVARVVPRPSN